MRRDLRARIAELRRYEMRLTAQLTMIQQRLNNVSETMDRCTEEAQRLLVQLAQQQQDVAETYAE